MLTVWLVAGSIAASSASPLQSDSERNRPRLHRHIGVDYLHFWLIHSAQRSAGLGSVYHSDEHPALVAFAHSLAQSGHGGRLQSHLAQNAELYETGMQPTGSPLLYGVLGVMRTGHYETDFWLFQFFSCLLFVVAVCMLGRIGKLTVAASLVICVGLIILFRPLRVDFDVANTNRIQLFLFAVCTWLLSRDRPAMLLAGIVMGLSMAFKLNVSLVPVFVVGACLLGKQVSSAVAVAAGSLLGAAVGVGLGGLLFGSLNHWILWRGYVAEIMKQPYPAAMGNYSTASLAGADFSPYISSLILLLLLAFGMINGLAKRQPFEMGNRALPLWGSIGLLAFLFLSPLAWSHYFVLAVPAFVLALGTVRQTGAFTRAGLPGTLLVVGSSLMFVAASMPWAADMTAIQISGLLQAGVLLLLIAALVAIPVQRMGPRSEGKCDG